MAVGHLQQRACIREIAVWMRTLGDRRVVDCDRDRLSRMPVQDVEQRRQSIGDPSIALARATGVEEHEVPMPDVQMRVAAQARAPEDPRHLLGIVVVAGYPAHLRCQGCEVRGDPPVALVGGVLGQISGGDDQTEGTVRV